MHRTTELDLIWIRGLRTLGALYEAVGLQVFLFLFFFCSTPGEPFDEQMQIIFGPWRNLRAIAAWSDNEPLATISARMNKQPTLNLSSAPAWKRIQNSITYVLPCPFRIRRGIPMCVELQNNNGRRDWRLRVPRVFVVLTNQCVMCLLLPLAYWTHFGERRDRSHRAHRVFHVIWLREWQFAVGELENRPDRIRRICP